MNAPPAGFKLDLTLDVDAASDPETVNEMLKAFPREVRPTVSEKLLLSDASSIPLVVLCVLLPAGGWALTRMLGPIFDEVGIWIRDAARAYRQRRMLAPPGVGMYIRWRGDPMEVRVSVEEKSLLSWTDPKQRFQQLREYLDNGLGEVFSRNPDWVLVRWDPGRESWIFVQILPIRRDRCDWYRFDPESGKWIEWFDKPSGSLDSRG